MIQGLLASLSWSAFVLLSYFSKRWFFLLAMVGIALVLQFPAQSRLVFDKVNPAVLAGTALFFMSISLATSRLWEAGKRPGPVLLSLAMTWLLAPLLAAAAAPYLLPEKFRIGLLITAALPCTLASATVWVRLSGGNEAIPLMTTILTNVFVFVGTSGWLLLLTGSKVALDPWLMVRELLVFVVLPILAAQGLRAYGPIGRSMDHWKSALSVLTRICVLLIIVKSAVHANTVLAAEAAEGGPRVAWNAMDLVQVALVCAGLHLVLLFTGYFLGKWMYSLKDAVSVAIAGSQKTLPVGVLVATNFFPDVALAIVPILFYHVLQLLLDTFVGEHFFLRSAAPPAVDDSELMTA